MGSNILNCIKKSWSGYNDEVFGEIPEVVDIMVSRPQMV